jgi:hypothetical protein
MASTVTTIRRVRRPVRARARVAVVTEVIGRAKHGDAVAVLARAYLAESGRVQESALFIGRAETSPTIFLDAVGRAARLRARIASRYAGAACRVADLRAVAETVVRALSRLSEATGSTVALVVDRTELAVIARGRYGRRSTAARSSIAGIPDGAGVLVVAAGPLGTRTRICLTAIRKDGLAVTHAARRVEEAAVWDACAGHACASLAGITDGAEVSVVAWGRLADLGLAARRTAVALIRVPVVAVFAGLNDPVAAG